MHTHTYMNMKACMQHIYTSGERSRKSGRYHLLCMHIHTPNSYYIYTHTHEYESIHATCIHSGERSRKSGRYYMHAYT